MAPRKPFVMACIALMLALVVAPGVLASSALPVPAAPLGVNLNFSPNPVNVGSQTQIQISVSGGSSPYFLWFNTSIPGCNPSSQPIQMNQSSSSFPCNPTSPGNFPAHLDVADNQGDHGSASASLTVQSTGGSGGTGSTGNNTGGIDLSFLNNLLPVLMITGILFLASTVAIAVSAVALAILVPRRLKQIRNALEAKPSADMPTTTPPPSPSEETPSGKS